MTGTPIGRDEELATSARFLERVSDGPAALVIEGVAGIGKTTLWSESVRRAREAGFRVLEARPGESRSRPCRLPR
jgi:hypothetical protein